MRFRPPTVCSCILYCSWKEVQSQMKFWSSSSICMRNRGLGTLSERKYSSWGVESVDEVDPTRHGAQGLLGRPVEADHVAADLVDARRDLVAGQAEFLGQFSENGLDQVMLRSPLRNTGE